MSADYYIERLERDSDISSIWEEWERLDAEITPRVPFRSPLWNALWWKHFRRTEFLTGDEFFLHVVRNQQKKLIAVVPWIIASRPALSGLGLRVLTYFGADANLTTVRGPICREEDEVAVHAALVDYLRSRAAAWDIIEWNGIRTAEALSLVETSGRWSPKPANPMYYFAVPSTWDRLKQSLSANARKRHRRAFEILEERQHKYSFRVIDDPEQIPQALERLFHLHSLRAKAEGMMAHPNKFKSHIHREFIADFCGKSAERGNVRIFELEIGGQIVANRLAFKMADTLCFYYTGYDPAWREFSVGTVLMVEAMKWVIDNRFGCVNLSTGMDNAKLQWRPRMIEFQGGTQATDGVRRFWTVPAYNALQWAKRKRKATFGAN